MIMVRCDCDEVRYLGDSDMVKCDCDELIYNYDCDKFRCNYKLGLGRNV